MSKQSESNAKESNSRMESQTFVIKLHVAVWRALGLVEPVIDMVEGLPVANVEDKDDAVRT